MASPRHFPPPPSLPPKHPPMEAEITVVSAKHLKNVNWRRGDLKPYAVLYLDPDRRVATRADDSGSTRPVWNERLALPLDVPLADALLTLQVFHSRPSETPKPLVGAARAPLLDLLRLEDAASSVSGSLPIRTLELRRPSGRPQGKVRIKVSVREVAPPVPPPHPPVPSDYHVPPPSSYYRSGAPPPSSARDYRMYASPSPPPLPCCASEHPPPSTVPSYSYSSYSDPYLGYYSAGYYSAPPAPVPSQLHYDGSSGYSGRSGPSAPVDYSSRVSSYDHKRRNGDMGLGAGLAVGAVAGALGGLSLEEGFMNEKEKIAERVEGDLAARDEYKDYRTRS